MAVGHSRPPQRCYKLATVFPICGVELRAQSSKHTCCLEPSMCSIGSVCWPLSAYPPFRRRRSSPYRRPHGRPFCQELQREPPCAWLLARRLANVRPRGRHHVVLGWSIGGGALLACTYRSEFACSPFRERGVKRCGLSTMALSRGSHMDQTLQDSHLDDTFRSPTTWMPTHRASLSSESPNRFGCNFLRPVWNMFELDLDEWPREWVLL